MLKTKCSEMQVLTGDNPVSFSYNELLTVKQYLLGS